MDQVHRIGGHDRPFGPDRVTALVHGSLCVDLVEAGGDEALGCFGHPVLLEHHTPLGNDSIGIQGGSSGPLVQDVKGHLDVLGAVQRHRQAVDGRITTRVGVHIGTNLHSEGLKGVVQLVAGVVGGAVEEHVLEEVGDARTCHILFEGACRHHQT